jgi:hypothetical protein
MHIFFYRKWIPKYVHIFLDKDRFFFGKFTTGQSLMLELFVGQVRLEYGTPSIPKECRYNFCLSSTILDLTYTKRYQYCLLLLN